MKRTLELKQKYADYWRDKDETWWLARLLQEVGELADTLSGETDDPRALELRQIASICLNWLDMRGEFEDLTYISEIEKAARKCPAHGRYVVSYWHVPVCPVERVLEKEESE